MKNSIHENRISHEVLEYTLKKMSSFSTLPGSNRKRSKSLIPQYLDRDVALKEFVENKRRRDLLVLEGKIKFSEDCDYRA